jgi:hypothetical protein
MSGREAAASELESFKLDVAGEDLSPGFQTESAYEDQEYLDFLPA